MGKAACLNDLKKVALALRSYESEHGMLPPPYTVDAEGRPLHSWRTLILPYLEQEALYRLIDLSRPWNDPVNAQALQTTVWEYRCPLSKRARNTTTYLAVVGSNACFNPEGPRRIEEIQDEHDQTLMVIEADEGSSVPWMAPYDIDERRVLELGLKTKARHEGKTHAAFVDSHVRPLPADASSMVRRAAISIAGDGTPTSHVWEVEEKPLLLRFNFMK